MPSTETAAVLETRGLTKRFGGLTATDDVSLSLLPGEVHALIGPNGAGKTTLIGLLTGELRPDAGAVVLQGRVVTHW
ncbi:MAG TPA: ATP-binding cassette domain-containing protein, partial [Quisquiliibacterium sp.]|nr:ATP-binding cassette domain-containing protein [Quisquiliibacterium sp.]